MKSFIYRALVRISLTCAVIILGLSAEAWAQRRYEIPSQNLFRLEKVAVRDRTLSFGCAPVLNTDYRAVEIVGEQGDLVIARLLFAGRVAHLKALLSPRDDKSALRARIQLLLQIRRAANAVCHAEEKKREERSSSSDASSENPPPSSDSSSSDQPDSSETSQSSASSRSDSSSSSAESKSQSSSESSSSMLSSASSSSRIRRDCGNGIIEEGEVCECGLDGRCGTADDQVGANSCGTLGASGGELRCERGCASFDVSACTFSNQISFVDGALSQDCSSGNYSITQRACNGSDGAAYQRVQTAANHTVPGSVVLVREGTYTPEARCGALAGQQCVLAMDRTRYSGQPGAPIRFQAYAGERVVLDNQGLRGSPVFIDGRNASGGMRHVEIAGFRITGGGVGIYAVQTAYNKYEYNEIYENSDKGIFIYEQSVGQNGTPPGDWGHHHVRRNDIHHNRLTGIYSTAPDSLFEYNYSHDNTDPSYPGNTDGFVLNGDHTVIRSNVAARNGDDGFDCPGNGSGIHYDGEVREPRYMVLEHNVSIENGLCYARENGERECGDGAGFKFHTHDPVVLGGGGPHVIRYNLAAFNRLKGFDYAGDYRPQDLPYRPNAVYGNDSYDNGYYNFYLEAAGGILFNNISWRTDGLLFDVRQTGNETRPLVSDFNLWLRRYIQGDFSGNFYTCMDNSGVSADPGFVNPTVAGINTDLTSQDFATSPGFRLLSNSPARDAGTNVRTRLVDLAEQIEQSQDEEVDVPMCSTRPRQGVSEDLWLESIAFALSVIPPQFSFDGRAPDMGVNEFEE